MFISTMKRVIETVHSIKSIEVQVDEYIIKYEEHVDLISKIIKMSFLYQLFTYINN